MFSLETRRSLFYLRQQLTIKLIENAPWGEVLPILKNMAEEMELPADGIGEGLKKEILVSARQRRAPAQVKDARQHKLMELPDSGLK
jgi:hypothetical protein